MRAERREARKRARPPPSPAHASPNLTLSHNSLLAATVVAAAALPMRRADEPLTLVRAADDILARRGEPALATLRRALVKGGRGLPDGEAALSDGDGEEEEGEGAPPPPHRAPRPRPRSRSRCWPPFAATWWPLTG